MGKTTMLEYLFDEIGEGNGWEKIPSVLNPPLYFLQSYIKTREQNKTIRVTSLLPCSFEQILVVANDLKVLVELNFLIKDIIKLNDEEVHFSVNSYILNVKGNINCLHGVIKENTNRFIYFQHQFNSKFFIYYFFMVERLQNGVKLTIQSTLDRDYTTNSIIDHSITSFAYITSNLCEYAKKDEEGIFISHTFKEFCKLNNDEVTLSRVVHQNEMFTIYSNNDYSEIILKGKVRFPLAPFSDICGRYADIVRESFFFPVSRVIKQTQRLTYYHNETPFLGDDSVMTDRVFGSIMVERGMFVFCRSVSSNNCPHSIKSLHYHFDDLLSGEIISWVGNVAHGEFVYHWSTPTLKSCSERKRVVDLKNFVAAYLLSRTLLQNGLSYKVPPLKRNYVLRSKDVLDCTIQVVGIINKKKIEKITEQKKKEVKGIFPLLELNKQTFHHILTYLSLESILCLSLANKELNSRIKNQGDIFKRFFDLHFNKNTFFVGETKRAENNQKVDENNYYLTVSHCQCLRKGWNKFKYAKPFEVKAMESEVSSIFILADNRYMVVGNNEGKCCQLDENFKTVKASKSSHKISRSWLDNERDTFSIALNNQIIEKMGRNVKLFERIPYPKFQDFNFIRNSCLFGKNENECYVYDLDNSKIIQVYRPETSGIRFLNEADNGLLVTISYGGKISGFDRKSNRIVFTTPQRDYFPLMFDSFENYIVFGTNEGTVAMFDERKNDICSQRQFYSSPINAIKIGNRRLFIATGFKSIINYSCFHGWFGQQQNLYRSKSNVTSFACNEEQLLIGFEDGKLVRFM